MTVVAAQRADTVLRIERDFAAPPARVFEAWTESDIFLRWFGPEGMHVSEHDLEIRPGGHYRAVIANKDGAHHIISGRYLTIDPPRRLVFTWGWENDGIRGHETTVTVTFEGNGDGTRLTLVQEEFETVESRDSHDGGWASTFNCLDTVLAEGA